MGEEDFEKYGMVLQEMIQRLLGNTDTTGWSILVLHNIPFAFSSILNISRIIFNITFLFVSERP